MERLNIIFCINSVYQYFPFLRENQKPRQKISKWLYSAGNNPKCFRSTEKRSKQGAAVIFD
jgi:hypothetical protein